MIAALAGTHNGEFEMQRENTVERLASASRLGVMTES